MTMTVTPAATAAPDAKKKSADVPTTGKLPLKGGKDGVTKTLDNKGVLKAPVDPKVKAAAEVYAKVLDKLIVLTKEADTASAALLDAFDRSHKTKTVRIVGEQKAYFFSKKTLTKLVVEKKSANEA
jgi:hypothetical protein